jgi:molybdopterin-binding protein
MIRLEAVSKAWEDFALTDISLDVSKGEYFVVLGPTGAGKTLLLETIAGFHYPNKGRVVLKDQNITLLPPSKRSMGFVYQDYMLFPNMDVAENIGYGMKLKGLDKTKIDRKVKELAELLGITHLLKRAPSKLSGGEAQRTALARALSLEPEVLLLDEPLSAMDPNLRAEIRAELRRMHKATGTTTIHVTHSREDAMVLGERIAVMHEGKIIQVGTAEEVFQHPGSKFVAEFVGVENIFAGTAEKTNGITTFNSNNVTIYSSTPVTGSVHASIRPEDIILSQHKIKASARNCLSGEVMEIIDLGQVMRIKIDTGITFAVNITRASCVDMKLSIGQNVYLIFKAQNVNLFN